MIMSDPLRSRITLPLLLIVGLLALAPFRAAATVEDSTYTTFVREPLDIAHTTATRTFLFPSGTESFRKIVMYVNQECAALGCDPWDRVATVTVSQPNGKGGIELYELGRIVTPAGRAGAWTIDVTDYRTLLKDSVTLNLHVETFIGGGKGHLVTVGFRFIAGLPDLEAYKVENLWAGLPEYGNPEKPIEEILRPIGMKADPAMEFAKIRITTTGHGDGNTDSAATYARKRHDLVIGSKTFTRYLWRDDCGSTPIRPQLGDWTRSRAGFCPGAAVIPWDNDVSALLSPGILFTVDYDVEPYLNRCRPEVLPCECENCGYGAVEHIMPIYWIESQVIYYRIPKDDPAVAASEVTLSPAAGTGRFIVRTSFGKPADLEVRVVDVVGEEIFYQFGGGVSDGAFDLDLSSTPGVYLLTVRSGGKTLLRKRLVVQ